MLLDYDSLDRLGTATGPWGSLGWTYDGVGNRQTEGATSYAYVSNTNKLASVGSTSYGFDNNGNTTAEGARQFTYNHNQRLIQVVDAGVTKGEYVYNGNGQRVKKTAGGSTTIFHYSLSGQIIAESNSGGSITAEYVFLNGQSLAKIEGSNVYYYHNDHLGTPQKMTDSTGQVVWAADYKPFGEANITVATITNNLRFPGQYFDAETGTHYNYFRDYNPVIGRYIEADPIGIKRGKNHLFVYVGNNALRFTDPFGLAETQGHNTTYTDGEGHFIVGGGVEVVTCCSGKTKILAAFGKVCFGAGFGYSVSTGGVYNVVKTNDCASLFKGFSVEIGAGPLEASMSASEGPPVAVGAGFGAGGKATLCYYFLLYEKQIGCCSGN